MPEVGTADVGLASAGYTARAQDASTVFTNPAGMTRLDGTQVLAGGQLMWFNNNFSVGGAFRMKSGIGRRLDVPDVSKEMGLKNSTTYAGAPGLSLTDVPGGALAGQTRTVPSWPVLTSCCPSGVKANPVIQRRWVPSGIGSAVRHRQRVAAPCSSPVDSPSLSGLKVREVASFSIILGPAGPGRFRISLPLWASQILTDSLWGICAMKPRPVARYRPSGL